jgi:hypothetical protein
MQRPSRARQAPIGRWPVLHPQSQDALLRPPSRLSDDAGCELLVLVSDTAPAASLLPAPRPSYPLWGGAQQQLGRGSMVSKTPKKYGSA